MQICARAYHWLLKLTRTIADLAGENEISQVHLAEGVCNIGRRFWGIDFGERFGGA